MKTDSSLEALENIEQNNRFSSATERNFLRLNKDLSNHVFSKRANKRDSTKQILPKEYFNNKDNVEFFSNLIKEASNKGIDSVQLISNWSLVCLSKKAWLFLKTANSFLPIRMLKALLKL